MRASSPRPSRRGLSTDMGEGHDVDPPASGAETAPPDAFGLGTDECRNCAVTLAYWPVAFTRGTFDQLFRDGHVCLGADRGDVVQQDRFAEAGRLGEADVPRYDRLKDLGAEVLSGIRRDLAG